MKFKKIVILLISVLTFGVYLAVISTPLYPGRLTVDINNTTLKTISGAVLEFEAADNTVVLPDIKPFERIILKAPSRIAEKPLKTRVFLNYNNQKAEILGEYHALNGDKYNGDVSQFAKAKIHANSITASTTSSVFSIIPYLNLKPYIRTIDMDTQSK